ncbi:MAG: glycosyltransferase family 4 protein [Candidatus Pacebacteria bacterium]|nr:glycosyltransferase family 4 protein [Candidatus Paceibacterota bacterium]
MEVKGKILICAGIFPPEIGGPATYAKLLLEELPKSGWEVKIVTYGDSKLKNKKSEKNEGVHIVGKEQNLVFRYLKYFFAVYRLAKWADVVYAQGPVSEGLPTMLACLLRGKKYILKVVGDYAWEQSCQRFGVNDPLDEFVVKKYSFRVSLLKKIQSMAAKRAKEVIVPSKYLKGIVMKWGVKEKKITVVYNSFEFPERQASKGKLRKKMDMSGIVVVSAGRLVPWKGFKELVGVVPEVAKKIPDIRLVIIGDGPEKQKIEEQIKKLGLENRVVLTGRVERKLLLDYLEAGDLFVLNTGYEGFSHLLMEAMAMEIPVLTTDAGGNVELVENGENGALIAVGDNEALKENMIRLCGDSAARWQLAQNAKMKIKEFTRERMLEETERVLNAMISK